MSRVDRSILIGWGITALLFFSQLVKAQKSIELEDVTPEAGQCYAKDGKCD